MWGRFSVPRLAFLQFYPNDWLAEPSIRACSVGARGLWIDLLSLMHLSPRRGYLLAASGKAPSHEQLARLTGCSSDEFSRLLAELESSGCFNCTDDGTIYSRRMVRDEGKRQKCAEAGHRGGLMSAKKRTLEGQPKGEVKGLPKGGLKLPETRDQKPEKEPPYPPAGGTDGQPTKPVYATAEAVPIPGKIESPDFRTAWADWLADRKSRRKAVTPLAAERQLENLAHLGPAGATECVLASLRNGWTGIFPERVSGDRTLSPGKHGAVGRPGRVEAPAGKYDHLDGPPGLAEGPGPPEPGLFSPAGNAA
mgnify:CR=1 FL=1